MNQHAQQCSRRRSVAHALAMALFAIALLAIAANLPGGAAAQPAVSTPNTKPLVLGAACTRAQNRPGRVKRDGCGQLYCGLRDVKELLEVIPNFATRMGCTWRVERRACRCIKTS